MKMITKKNVLVLFWLVVLTKGTIGLASTNQVEQARDVRIYSLGFKSRRNSNQNTRPMRSKFKINKKTYSQFAKIEKVLTLWEHLDKAQLRKVENVILKAKVHKSEKVRKRMIKLVSGTTAPAGFLLKLVKMTALRRKSLRKYLRKKKLSIRVHLNCLREREFKRNEEHRDSERKEVMRYAAEREWSSKRLRKRLAEIDRKFQHQKKRIDEVGTKIERKTFL